MTHPQAQKMMQRLFVDGSARGSMRTLREHLRGCPDCSQQYDKLVAAGHLKRLDEPAPQLDDARLARLETEFFKEWLPAARTPRWQMQWSWRWAAGLASAAAMSLALIAIWPKEGGIDAALYPTRGIPASTDRERRVAIRVFTLTDQGSVQELRNAGGDIPLLPADAPVKLSYSNLDPEIRHLLICVLDAAGRGACNALPATTIEPDSIDAMLPGQAVLGADRHGSLRIYALFSEEPLDAQVVLEALHSTSPGAERVSGLKDALQDGLLLRLP